MARLSTLRFRLLAWISLLALGLEGCANREVAYTLPLQQAAPFSRSGEVELPDRWWTTFENSALNRQVEASLGGNYTLSGAWERLRAARALTRREATDLFPDLNGVGEIGGTTATSRQDQSRFALGLDAAYQVDLWGQIESRVDAERLRTSATLADYQALALTLSAEVARSWFSMIEARAQLALLNDQLKTNLDGVERQETAFELGQIRSPDLLRQRQLAESSREQIVIAQSRIDLLEHRLAVLQGRRPQEVTYNTGSELPSLPPLPNTGLPSELLNRRPDVRRAFLELQAADRDLASAVSAQYPRLDLTASVTTAAESPEDLFRNWIASTAGQLVAPLFDAGQRRAEVERNAAIVRERFTEYGQSVLVAYREVEDSLALERYQQDRIDHLNAQLEHARKALGPLREQYYLDETDFLNVLSATTDLQRLQRETLSARLDIILTRISLYLALAGDFEVGPQLPGDAILPQINPSESDMPGELVPEEVIPENVLPENSRMEVDSSESVRPVITDLRLIPPEIRQSPRRPLSSQPVVTDLELIPPELIPAENGNNE